MADDDGLKELQVHGVDAVVELRDVNETQTPASADGGGGYT